MRIALVTREYPPETSWGGIGTHYAAFSAGLRAAGCEVEVFTQGLTSPSIGDENGVLVHRVVPRTWLAGPKIGGDMAGHSLRTIGIFSLSLAREFATAFRARHAESPFDIVDAHEHLGVSGFLRGAKNMRPLIVARYQTAYDSFVTRRMANWPRSRLVRWLENRAIQNAHIRVATSHSIESITREDFPRTPPADEIIPNLTAVSFPVSDVDLEKGREPLMLFAGRLMPGHKNPDHVAAAFARVAPDFPEWRVEFAGNDIPLDANTSMWDRCEEILRPFRGRYYYHGRLPPEELARLYRRASILIVPSRIESYGLVALEAMANGCVPLVANNTALPEVVGEAGVVFDNGDLDSLERQLRPLLADGTLREGYRRAGIEKFRRDYSPDSVVATNIALFERELGKLRPR